MKKLIFLLFPVFSYGQIAINKLYYAAASVTTNATAFGISGATFTTGKLYLLITASTGTTNPGTLTSSTLTWSSVINYGDATRRIQVFRCVPGSTATGENVSLGTFGGGSTGFLFGIWEITGFDITTPIAQLNFDSQTGANPTITLAALQNSRSAVISVFFNNRNGFSGAEESGWVEDLDDGYTTPDAGSYIMSRTTTTDNTPTVTSSSSTWIGIALEIKAAGRRATVIN